MSLVAVVTRPGDRPGELPETRVVPVGMAQDTAFGAYFPKPGFQVAHLAASAPLATKVPMLSASLNYAAAQDFQGFLGAADACSAPPEDMPSFSRSPGRFARLKNLMKGTAEARPAETAEDVLLDLASRMESDGGMPGKDRESRAIATVIAVLAFLSQGHSPAGGAFRSHVSRLVSFLKSLTSLSSRQQRVVGAVIELARRGSAPAGEWITLAHTSGNHWSAVEESVLSV
jgi:hypothetical protein